MKFYNLDENNQPVECSMMEWGEIMHNGERRKVQQTYIDGRFISTMFLGINHGCEKDLILFETMVFDNDERRALKTKRYRTYAEALAGHKLTVDKYTDKNHEPKCRRRD